MAQSDLNSDDPKGESPSANKGTEPAVVENKSSQQKTDNGDNDVPAETVARKDKRKDNGSDEEHGVKSKAGPELKNAVTEANGDSSNSEETESLKEALKKIQDQKTHALYCPKCTLDITKYVQLLKKTEAPYPYDQKIWVLWVPFVLPFSFIWRWYTRIRPGQTAITPSDQPTKEGDSIPLLDGVNPQDRNHSFLGKKYLLYLLVVILPLLLVIVLWALPSSKGGGNKKPSLPSLPLPIHFPMIKYLPVILLFLLAILILAWQLRTGSMPSIITILKGPNIDMLRKYMVDPFKKLPSIKLDILKSIVYGGLIESITSLGVVSSAAGSGASTLNVLALGVANLFSGILLISHNFCVLRWRLPYRGENHHDMTNLAAKDHPYEILLGKKKFTLLHSVVVLVSLLTFAVIPPLLYGFSYKIIDREHSKAAVVLAVSLVCVISLSFAKAYAFTMHKLKTVAEYTGIAIVASVLSFLAGQYFIHVFGKLDLH